MNRTDEQTEGGDRCLGSLFPFALESKLKSVKERSDALPHSITAAERPLYALDRELYYLRCDKERRVLERRQGGNRGVEKKRERIEDSK